MTDNLRIPPVNAAPASTPGRRAPDPRLTPLLAQLAAASTTGEIADAAVGQSVALLGGRAAALGLLSAGASRVEIVGSVGYGCGMMSPGSSLAGDTDLPLTRAATTGRTVVEAGAWIAAPLAPGPSPLGALLVSLSGPTPTPACDAALVEEIAAHTRAALARLPRRLPRPAVSESRQEADGVAAVVRLQPVSHPSGGDVVELWSAGDGSCWLLVADACGADAGAAATALAVSVAARAISGVVDGPAALLSALDRALAATPRVDRFVTAVAARLRNTEAGMVVTLATAGHPAPFLLSAETASYVDLPADAPLNLRVGVPLGPTERVLTLGPREQLLFFTDGATDRAAGAITDDVLAVIASGSPGSAVGPDARAATADAGALALARISDALDVAGGPSRDDMTLALVGQAVDARRAPAGSPRTN